MGLSLLFTALLCSVGDGDSRGTSYARDVRPILAEHCFQCHGPDERKRKARTRLDTAAGLSALGSERRRIAEPGDVETSELWLRVTSGEDLERMPPAEHGRRLETQEFEVLRRWIESGARWEPHWAFAPFREVEPPPVRDEAWIANPIDRFVLARLEREGLAPAPEADRRTLMRRASLDLIGMVPALEEVEAFVADERPDAWERAVDRLLASPHYGERWARPWLDLARYADSHGFTIDGGRSMWPWRDWVVRAIDADMPFERFTIEQLAGDLLPDATNAQTVATAFHRNTQINQEGGAKDEENRVLAVIDRVNTTAAVWLGSTMACAQCHSHKFDPISQTEYYRMFAFFDQTEDGGVSSGPRAAVSDAETEEQLAQFEAERERLAAELDRQAALAATGWVRWRPARWRASEGPELELLPDGSLRSIGHNPQTSVYSLEGPVPAAGLAALRLEALPDLSLSGRGPGRASGGKFEVSSLVVAVRAHADAPWRELELDRDEAWGVQTEPGRPHAVHYALETPLPAEARELRVELRQERGSNHVLGRFRLLVRATPQGPGGQHALVPSAWTEAWQALVEHEGRALKLPTVLVMRERAERRTTRVFERGSFLDPGPAVEAGFPAAINHFARDGNPRTRLDLARWLVHPENALVWRVTVNRWWQSFFGLGIVATENDFGLRGAAPTHPDLLEWLARELVRRQGSRKQIHRLIVTSRTYRQSSRPRPELSGIDPRNRLLARQSRLRTDAECIRDSALRASGLLEPERFGPPVQPPQPQGVFAFTQSNRKWEPSAGPDRFRRTLYTRIWRSAVFPFLTTFDAPVPSQTCTRRLRSNTPLQALTLANDPMMIEIAAGLAARVVSEAEDDSERIDHLFRLCLSRPATAAEQEILEQHLASQRERHASLAGEEAELRAWSALARVMLNLDEFVTRE